NVLILNGYVVAEKDFEHSAEIVSILRLDELTNDGKVDRTDQVREKDEAVFEHGQCMDGLSRVVVGNLSSHLTDALLDLLGGNDDISSGRCEHRVPSSSRILASSRFGNKNSGSAYGTTIAAHTHAAHPNHLSATRD